jgi:hypothetical protein
VSQPTPPSSSAAADDLLHFITSDPPPPPVPSKTVDVPSVTITTQQQQPHTMTPSSVVQQVKGQSQQGVEKKVIDISVVDISSPVAAAPPAATVTATATAVVVSENSPVSSGVDNSNNSAKKPVARTMNLKVRVKTFSFLFSQCFLYCRNFWRKATHPPLLNKVIHQRIEMKHRRLCN